MNVKNMAQYRLRILVNSVKAETRRQSSTAPDYVLSDSASLHVSINDHKLGSSILDLQIKFNIGEIVHVTCK